MTASATFMGNSLGPLCGGLHRRRPGHRWVFAMTAILLMANLIWVYLKGAGEQGRTCEHERPAVNRVRVTIQHLELRDRHRRA